MFLCSLDGHRFLVDLKPAAVEALARSFCAESGFVLPYERGSFPFTEFVGWWLTSVGAIEVVTVEHSILD